MTGAGLEAASGIIRAEWGGCLPERPPDDDFLKRGSLGPTAGGGLTTRAAGFEGGAGASCAGKGMEGMVRASEEDIQAGAAAVCCEVGIRFL